MKPHLTGFLVGILAALALDMGGAGYMDPSTEIGLNLVGIVIGGITAAVVYQKMPDYVTINQDLPGSDDLLDDEMFR